MKILVVDDEALLVKGIRFNLQNEGYEVITGSDGLEAVQAVQTQHPDLVVLDVMMPKLNGFQVARQVRADRCTTPTLFIHSEEDYRCWMVEALQMYSTLIHHGVPTRLCLFHGENHELSRGGKPKGRIRRLQEITAWMDKYLKEE